MLVIRLARTGKKKQAFFRIVVADKRRAVGAKFVEILGNYNPHAKKLELNQERLNEYMKNGAQPSNTLAKILKKEGFKLPKWVCITEKNKPTKKAEAAEASQGGEAENEPKTEVTPQEAVEVAEENQATEAEPAEEIKEKAEEKVTEEPKAEEVKKESSEEAKDDKPKEENN